MEGRAAAVRGAAAGVLGDGRARERRLRGLAARAAGLAAVVISGSAAPRIRARHCRAKIGGTIEPSHVSGQRQWPPPRQTSAAPPCMARHRHLAAPGQ